LVRHRYELIHESTQRRNKLTAICDELFPELSQVIRDVNSLVALALREQFPTPQALATASFTTLQQLRGGARCISDAKLSELQQLAAESIGIKDLIRQRGLLLEQRQLIKELQLVRQHIEQLENEMKKIVEQAREGQILMSFPGVGPITAASVIAAIGSIQNFPSASSLKSYFGWAPALAQSGTSLDRSHLTRGGTRTMKQMMFLVVFHIIRSQESEWAHLYERLVRTRCPYDERKQAHVGKIRVMGRVAGQIIEAMYALLMRDAELLSKIPPGHLPPPPLLYDPEVHRRHRQGEYRPLKSTPLPNTIILLPTQIAE
jgi:transposase